MSIWNYAYLFPESDGRLVSEEILNGILALGLEPDSDLIELELDEDGHCIEGSLREDVEDSPAETIRSMLRQGLPVQIACRNTDLFVTCTFATCGSNPHIRLGWSRRLFGSLSESLRSRYQVGLSKASSRPRALYVVFMEEVPDYFEDRFVFIENAPVIDLRLNSGRFEPIEKIWIDHGGGGILPHGAEFDEGRDIGDGYSEYTCDVVASDQIF